MEFETEAQRAQYHLVLGWMRELFGAEAIPQEAAPAVVAAVGSTFISVVVAPWGNDDAIINVRAYVADGAELQPGLLHDLLRRNDEMQFGSFGVGSEGTVFLQHALLASGCQRRTFLTVVTYLAMTADEHDDQLVGRWGGRRAADVMGVSSETSMPSVENAQDGRPRREVILATLRELWQDESAFVIFSDADQPDNYVQFADFGGHEPLVMEVTSRAYEEEGQDLPRLTPEQIEALAALGFSREVNPNHHGEFSFGDPEYFADLAERAFAILGSSPEGAVRVSAGNWQQEEEGAASEGDRPQTIPVFVEKELPEFDAEAGEETLAKIKALQAPHRTESGEVRPAEPPYIVTCMEWEGSYQGFDEEADIMLICLSQEMQGGGMTGVQAREAFRPYREFYPEVYEPGYGEEEEDDWGFPLVTEDLGPHGFSGTLLGSGGPARRHVHCSALVGRGPTFPYTGWEP